MKRWIHLFYLALVLTTPGCAAPESPQASIPPSRPNIVYILADDLGYGDVSCLNENSKIQTPHMDQLAREGMVFTDAHSSSAVCTPSRYSILTGRYCWRTRLKQGVLGGYSPPLIEPGRLTVASMLKEQGYHTACIGKWHLGWRWQMKTDNPKEVDYSQPIQQGPGANGFDYSFCIPASLDMAPYVYVENDYVTSEPNRVVPAEKGKAFYRSGPTGGDFRHKDVLPRVTRKAVSYIENRAQDPNHTPFFLYLPLPAPHTPILPSPEFQGKSRTNAYGDFVLQVDWTVGQVMQALRRHHLEQNTWIVVTSDNGCSPEADFQELAQFQHDPSYVFRGHKADIFEGGHRIPFLTRWPNRIAPGSVCDDIICLSDLMATCADITDYALPANAGEDSVSLVPDLLATAGAPVREAIVHHSINGSFSIRQGSWKLELCPGSGGWSPPKPGRDSMEGLPDKQLYDLSRDIGETTNVQDQHPDVVERLTRLLNTYRESGRSTSGY